MRLLAWSIEKNPSATPDRARHLLDTANKFGLHVEFVGQGIQYNVLRDKLYTLRDYLDSISDEQLVICIDGYDTLINKSFDSLESTFSLLNTEIVISSERMFTYQWGNFKDKFDTIQSPYRYVNSGTLIGKSKHLKKMLDECIELHNFHKTTIDQGLVGVWVYNNIENTNKVMLDTECMFTWVVSGEWGTLKDQSASKVIMNPYNNVSPFIIHSPGNNADFHFKCFQQAHQNILNR